MARETTAAKARKGGRTTAKAPATKKSAVKAPATKRSGVKAPALRKSVLDAPAAGAQTAEARRRAASRPRSAARFLDDGSAVASRPYMPGYGIPDDRKGLLSWSHVTEKMTAAMHYWVSTVGPDGHPHATPVDGLWHDGGLFFGGAPTTRRSRNLLANTAACVHLEGAMDVVILHGEAPELRDATPELTRRLAALSKAKYGWSPPPEQFAAGGVFVFRPRVVFAWKNFPKDATRFTVAETGD